MNLKIATAVVVASGLLTFGALSATQASAYRGDATQVGPYHTEEREAAMTTVMNANDYAGWKALMTEDGRTPGVLNKIDTQEEFLKFAEAYRLQKAGKTTEANAIRTELGLGNGTGRGQGHGMRNGSGAGCTER